MLQDKKLQFQRQLEEYLEDQKVYDIFEDMMKGLIVSRPKDPLKFLVSRLTSPESRSPSISSSPLGKRLIIVGPPGSKRKEIALSLAEYLSEERENQFVCISVGDLLRKEISKKSEFGKQIVESRRTYSYVRDEIVIELVRLQIEQLQKENPAASWIIEGFPRTRQQAIALQRMGVVPDKFILLDIVEGVSIDKVKMNLKSEDEIIQFQEDDIDAFSESALTEYRL